MKRSAFYVIIIIFFLASCQKEINFNPPFEGEKLNINGFISFKTGISVKLTHTRNPVGTYYLSDSTFVNDAMVIIYKNATITDTLVYRSEGIYKRKSETDNFIEKGVNYHLKVISKKYGTAESASIKLPEEPSISFIDFKVMNDLNAYGVKYAKLSLIIENNELSKDSYYLLYTNEDFITYNRVSPLNSNVTFVAEACYASVSNWLIFKDECLLSKSDTLCFGINLQNYSSAPLYKTIYLTIGTSNHDLWDYAKSFNDLSGIEYGFAEPKILHSNIIGGYGLFYPKNDKEFSFDVKY